MTGWERPLRLIRNSVRIEVDFFIFSFHSSEDSVLEKYSLKQIINSFHK